MGDPYNLHDQACADRFFRALVTLDDTEGLDPQCRQNKLVRDALNAWRVARGFKALCTTAAGAFEPGAPVKRRAPVAGMKTVTTSWSIPGTGKRRTRFGSWIRSEWVGLRYRLRVKKALKETSRRRQDLSERKGAAG